MNVSPPKKNPHETSGTSFQEPFFRWASFLPLSHPPTHLGQRAVPAKVPSWTNSVRLLEKVQHTEGRTCGLEHLLEHSYQTTPALFALDLSLRKTTPSLENQYFWVFSHLQPNPILAFNNRGLKEKDYTSSHKWKKNGLNKVRCPLKILKIIQHTCKRQKTL